MEVFWDFDDSLIDTGDSDRAVYSLDVECEDLVRREYKKTQWTQLIDEVLRLLQDKGYDEDVMRRRLQEIPLANSASVLFLYDKGCKQVIISDANTFYITTVLKKHQIDHCFDDIITNPNYYYERNGKTYIGIKPLLQNGHDCEMKCPVNMCKSLCGSSHFTSRRQKEKVGEETTVRLYVGDGKNDLCPIMRHLTARDFALIRREYSCHKHITKHSLHPQIAATIVYWDNPSDLFASIQRIYAARTTTSDNKL